jgi:hypothetical protein
MHSFIRPVHLRLVRFIGPGDMQPAGLGGPVNLFLINLKGYL